MKLNLSNVVQFVLKKHHLLEGTKATDVITAVKDIVGFHAASTVTPYLSLFARVNNFKRQHLDQELYERRNLARIKCMRSTYFIMTKEVLPIICRVYKGEPSNRLLRDWGISLREYEEISRGILKILEGRTLTVSQIKGFLPSEAQRTLSRRSGKNIVRITILWPNNRE